MNIPRIVALFAAIVSLAGPVCAQESGKAAAADASATAAKQSAAQAQAAASTKTPQQKLAELQSLYDQKLISQSDYEAAKTKILNQVTQ